MLRKWSKFCSDRNINLWKVDINTYLLFVTELYDNNYSYASLNSARSALSSICDRVDGFSVGEHPLIIKFMKGVSKLRPPAPKYSTTWDAAKVLGLLESWSSEDISMKLLTFKLVSLLSITSAQRVQTISLIKISNILWGDTIQIQITDTIKTTKINRPNRLIILPPYHNKALCPVSTLSVYIERTKMNRGNNDSLFISFMKPFAPVSSQTISRSLCEVLKLSGIDVEKYGAHSFRHSSSSKAASKGINTDTILRCVGWSEKSKTFARYYHRPLDDKTEYALAVLSK